MDIARHWRLRKQRYALEGEQCDHCGKYLFPPRDICPHCGEEAKQKRLMSGKGEVYSFTVIHDPPTGYEEQAPYAVALVKLQEGPMITAQLTDVDTAEVRIGMPVEMVTRRLRSDGDEGVIHYGYKFRPVLKAI
jgi:scaffold protein (connect acetoacetyl-CoA thiolase and HMG-CoA synthase)